MQRLYCVLLIHTTNGYIDDAVTRGNVPHSDPQKTLVKTGCSTQIRHRNCSNYKVRWAGFLEITRNRKIEIFRILKISKPEIDRNFQDPENFEHAFWLKSSGSWKFRLIFQIEVFRILKTSIDFGVWSFQDPEDLEIVFFCYFWFQDCVWFDFIDYDAVKSDMQGSVLAYICVQGHDDSHNLDICT